MTGLVQEGREIGLRSERDQERLRVEGAAGLLALIELILDGHVVAGKHDVVVATVARAATGSVQVLDALDAEGCEEHACGAGGIAIFDDLVIEAAHQIAQFFNRQRRSVVIVGPVANFALIPVIQLLARHHIRQPSARKLLRQSAVEDCTTAIVFPLQHFKGIVNVTF